MAQRRLSEELRRTLHARLQAMHEEIETLRGRLGRSNPRLNKALVVVDAYPGYARDAFDAEWAANPAEPDRIGTARSILLQTVWVEILLESWLVQNFEAPVPPALVSTLEREFELMGQPRNAILSMRPADGYFTYVAELADLVLSELSKRVPPPSQAHWTDRFALMQIPRLQVEDPATWPIIGHEAAHLGLLAKPDPRIRVNVRGQVDWLALSAQASGQAPNAVLAAELCVRAEKWVEESICDAYALRRFGPAAVAALGSFFDTLDTMYTPGDEHPPGHARMSLLLKWLGDVRSARIRALVEPWNELVSGAQPKYDPENQVLVDLITGPIGQDIPSALHDWPSELASKRVRAIGRRADRLLSGELGLEPNQASPDFTADAEVSNALWIALVEQDRKPEAEDVPVAQLATKTLDVHEFQRVWSEAEKAVAGGQPMLASSVFSSSEVPLSPQSRKLISGALAGPELHRRLTMSGPKRLGFQPLLANAVSGASIDLRLGTQFIVFKRMNVTSIDPVYEQADPRSIQSAVEKPWGEPFVLHPGELVLACTLEYIVMPDDLVGHVITRSSYGRFGLITATAVLVHPHFRGCLTLELDNRGVVPISLTPGQRITQLFLQTTTGSAGPSPRKYHCPTGPQFSQVALDPETEVLRRIRERPF